MNVLETDGVLGQRAGLRQNPDFSGFASRKIWISALPGIADGHVGETSGFPDLLMVISRKPVVSQTRRWSCRGNRRFAGLVKRRLYIRRTAQARGVPFARANYFHSHFVKNIEVAGETSRIVRRMKHNTARKMTLLRAV